MDKELLRAIYDHDINFISEMISDGQSKEIVDRTGAGILINSVIAPNRKLEFIDKIINLGLNLDQQDNIYGFSALHFASVNYDKDVIELLVKKGASLNIVDKNGNTPLWRAVMNCTQDLYPIEILLNFGSDPHFKNLNGVSPYDLSLMLSDDKLRNLLS